MRDQFEKLPEIARRIAESNSLNYDEESKGWRSPEWDSTTCCNEDFVNAAWYAFQEQQKKIDAVLRFVDGYDSIDIENSVNLRDCVNEIEGLLK